MKTKTPIIAVLCDRKHLAPHNFHCVGDKYLRALVDAAGALPWIVPALESGIDIDLLLDQVDGLFLPGSYANIEPHHYGQQQQTPESPTDPSRDSMAFTLIKKAIERKMPILGVCRGFQEINVLLGGSLYQRVQDIDGLQDHREDDAAPVTEQYADVHPVTLESGGLLSQLTDKTEVMVNSIHQQGINELASALSVEARAKDGLIEAYSSNIDEQFILAVQWHPEWQVNCNPFNASLFAAFRGACLTYKNR